MLVPACMQGVASDTSSLGSTIIGTYGFMAPEQFRGAAQPASDLYALGATLLFLLTGGAGRAGVTGPTGGAVFNVHQGQHCCSLDTQER